MGGWSPNDQVVIPAERHKKILAFIEDKGSAQIRELAEYQSVSEATIRRDLNELAKLGSIERTHGGAILSRRSTSFEHIYNEKASIQSAEKRRIGKLAATYVEDGYTVFLDSGTTSFQIAMNVSNKKNLTVITYDLSIAGAIELHPSSSLIVTGGIKRNQHNVLVGSITENFIRGIKVDIVFLTADAIDPQFGVSNANFIEMGIKTTLVKAGKQVILVADKTKFGKVAVAKVCDIKDLSMIISDSGLSKEIISSITEYGVPVKLA